MTHRFALALALGLCASVASAQDSSLLQWNPPTTNTDGTPLTDLFGYRVAWGLAAGSYPNSLTLPGAGLRSYLVQPLAPGTWYFVVSAINTAGVESVVSNVASKVVAGVVLPPGPVINPDVTPVVAPPPGAGTITLTGRTEFRLVVPAGMRATLSVVPTGGMFDWVKVGSATGTDVPTTPPLGSVNNDGILSNAITVDGPIDAMTDTDGSVPTGFVATVGGVTKTLVQNGTTWSVSFP